MLKIVSGVEEDEIRISELNIIKNKIQQAAGRDVNIIEGIGNDPTLEGSVSITVIATGFQTKRVNEPVTIKLEENEEEINSEIESKIEIKENQFNSQQTLLLDDDIEFENSVSENEFQNVNVEGKIVVDLDLDESTENPEDFINNVIE